MEGWEGVWGTAEHQAICYSSCQHEPRTECEPWPQKEAMTERGMFKRSTTVGLVICGILTSKDDFWVSEHGLLCRG